MSFIRVDDKNKERPTGRNCILVYGYSEEALVTIDALRAQTGMDETVPVSAAALGNTLLEILENRTSDKPYEKEIGDSILVFNAPSDLELNTFLNLFRTSGLKKALIAVVTKTSIGWRFGDLAVELGRERRAMKKKK